MSCWIAPSVAAELWGISIKDVMNAIECGAILAKQEEGMTFVSFSPNWSSAQKSNQQDPKPATYIMLESKDDEAIEVTEEEGAALSMSDWTQSDWRIAREATGRKRKPPMAA